MLIAIFSYNRGLYLENCFKSIKQCIPDARVVIIDDDSTDTDTLRVLEKLSAHCDVIQPGHKTGHRLGGLYANMQLIYERFKDEPLLCFLQDDTQVVRPVGVEEIEQLNQLFEVNETLGFICHSFLRGRNRQRDNQCMRYVPELGLYTRQGTTQSAGQNFSAISIMKPQRLHDKDWQFMGSEPENDKQAARLFGPMGFMFAPFAMWLPGVPAYRGKRKTWALRIAEKRSGAGFYPFNIMDEAQVAALKKRAVDLLPFAEDYLSCIDKEPPKPWGFYPMQDFKLLKKLSNLELALKKFFSKNR